MYRLRRAAALPLLLAGCYSPNTPIVVDGAESPTTGGVGTTGADSTGASDPSTTAPASSEGGPGDSSGASSISGTEASSSDGGPTDTGAAESSSTTGEPADCVGVAGRTVWINFDGGTLEQGVVDNGPGWVTENELAAGDWPPYDDAAEGDADEIMALLHEQWNPFDICLTREQPEVADFELVLVSSTTFLNNPDYPGPGSAPDCGDIHVNNVIVRTMPPEANLPTATKVISISSALGRSFGLEAVNAPEDLMNYAAGGTLNGASFTDACTPIYYPPQDCAESPGCDTDEQNSYAVLLQLLGPA
ncbi:MAG: hypothetical protein JNK45_33900 [Myxococcales bacterium]|nr:hypothetical protein [Myxococcales bacterium]